VSFYSVLYRSVFCNQVTTYEQYRHIAIEYLFHEAVLVVALTLISTDVLRVIVSLFRCWINSPLLVSVVN